MQDFTSGDPVRTTITAEPLPMVWQGVLPPSYPHTFAPLPPPLDLNQVMRDRCKDAGTIGFLTGVLEGLRHQVSDEIRQRIDDALERVKE